MHYTSHLATAKQLLSLYKPGLPFNQYLKKYFGENKKHGSRDRKLIAGLCYNYFRLGFAMRNIAIEERILFATFLCETKHSELLQFYKPEWNTFINESLKVKISILNSGFSIQDVFSFSNNLSEGIDRVKFNISILLQPKLFLRIRPGYKNIVYDKLNSALIAYEEISGSCIALPNSSKIDSVIELDKEAVVQDYNSQRTAEFLKLAIGNPQSEVYIWDCCAASGGKSIMAYDINHLIRLKVSDKRKLILQNLEDRFAKAGIKNYKSFVTDLSEFNDNNVRNKKNSLHSLEKVGRNPDIIIADVPCTGSGTWSRTPEQLFYFDKKQIEKYHDLQKRIVENIATTLRPGGYLLYITCSVFKKENEDVADFIESNLKMKKVKIELLQGYEMLADTMFAALFIMPGNN